MKSQELRDAEYAVDRLFQWADNEQFPPTYAAFLILTGNIDGHFGKPLGWLEADLLAKALAAWTDYPDEINELVQKHFSDG